MMYLVDTDWVVDYLKGRTQAIDTLNRLVKKGLAISIITYGEIYEGIYFGQDPKLAEKGFLNFLRVVDILGLNRTTMKRFALIRGDLRQRGALIGDPDLMIAATATLNKLTLITRNKKHFEKVEGLELFSENH